MLVLSHKDVKWAGDPPGRLVLDPGDLVRYADNEPVIYVPPHGHTVHAGAVNRVARDPRHSILAYEPMLPVASKLGLPRYGNLFYRIPAGIDPRRAASALLETFGAGTIPPATLKDRMVARVRSWTGKVSTPAIRMEDLAPVENAAPAAREEELFYFVTNYSQIKPFPGQVSVVMSNRCNLKCVMCPYHSPLITLNHTTDYFKSNQQMRWELLEAIAEECGERKASVKVGNIEEPLLHPRMVDFVKACREAGAASFHITTNGTPLTRDKSVELLEAGLTSLYVSIDGLNPETYARVRGWDLERLEANILSFLEVRRELGSACRFMVSFIKNEGVSADECNAFLKRWLPLLDGAIVYNLATYDGKVGLFKERNVEVEHLLAEAGGRWACLNPFQEIYVLPDGRTYYCCETVSQLAYENIESMGQFPEQSLASIWKGPIFAGLRGSLIQNELEEHPACRDCKIWDAHVASSHIEDNVKVTFNLCTYIYEEVRPTV